MPLAALLLPLFLPLSGIGQGGQSPSPSLAEFVSSLQQAVSRNDRRAVAGMVRYPLEVSAAGLQIPVADANAFVGLYDTIISPAVKQVIARARVPADGKTTPGAVRTSNGGITFDGALTISPVSGAFRITRITVPTGAQSKPPGEPIERQLTFRVGQPTLVSGTVEPGGTDRYVFHALRGAYVEARLTGVPGKTVLLRLIDIKTGKPVDARAETGTRVWTGRVSADGSYRIEVVRQPDSGKEPLIYTMSVAVK